MTAPTETAAETLTLIERAQPWLGTIVSLGVAGLDDAKAHEAIDATFSVVRNIHDLMSFHQQSSDVSRLNAHAHEKTIEVDPRTFAVISHACDLSKISNGVFDIAVGAALVAWGYLPNQNAQLTSGGSWRDIELIAPNSIRFHRPLQIDLGGIAKGYAVDQAAHQLISNGATEVRINAGGDIRIEGTRTHQIMLRVPGHTSSDVPVLEVSNCALASSSNATTQRQWGDRMVGPHVNGATGEPVGFDTFVTVVADTCVVADALTKVVLALGEGAEPILKHFNATAYMHNPTNGWHVIGLEQ